jgi:ABC-type Fe3+-hydroxamate transport system substrate-binding protein
MSGEELHGATGAFHSQRRPSDTPCRIVSLVPSTTETLADLGLEDHVVGRTRYCVHPQPWVDGIPEVGGTKDPDAARIAALSPDLIVGNHEENKPAHFDVLDEIAPLWIAYPRDVDGSLADITALAALTGVPDAGRSLVDRVSAARAAFAAATEGRRPFRYAYLIWRGPCMAVNDDTFISALLAEAGGSNVFGARAERYPKVSLEELRDAEPDAIYLPSEPYHFTEEHIAELQDLAPLGRLVDGELLSWHGSRLAAAFPYLVGLTAS